LPLGSDLPYSLKSILRQPQVRTRPCFGQAIGRLIDEAAREARINAMLFRRVYRPRDGPMGDVSIVIPINIRAWGAKRRHGENPTSGSAVGYLPDSERFFGVTWNAVRLKILKSISATRNGG
jgi:hypothetical protein